MILLLAAGALGLLAYNKQKQTEGAVVSAKAPDVMVTVNPNEQPTAFRVLPLPSNPPAQQSSAPPETPADANPSTAPATVATNVPPITEAPPVKVGFTRPQGNYFGQDTTPTFGEWYQWKFGGMTGVNKDYAAGLYNQEMATFYGWK